ncbi:MAG: hypothetical protein QM779_08380 [Propionicimonas sp.]|uniref:hypothetical protein n=1 Tax=Propionicimonas sp. TaxID=1955623 RepID=UPI003D0C5602
MEFRRVGPALALAAILCTACSGISTTGSGQAQPFADVTSTSSPAATPSPSATPSTLSVADTVPQGKWNGAETIVKVSGDARFWWDPVPKKGQKISGSDPWEFTSTCSDSVCTGTITRDGDAEAGVPSREFTWDGTTLTVTRDPMKGSDGCHYDNSTKSNGGKWTWQRTWTYDLSVDTDTEGRVTAINSDVTIRDEALKVPYEKCGEKPKPASYLVRSTMKLV